MEAAQALGFATFPLWPVRDGKCGCGNSTCSRVGKHPACEWSLIRPGEQLSGPEGYGTAIVTGERSGVIVLDFDTLDALEAMQDKLPLTTTVKTARGAHLYFRWPGFRVSNSASALADGVDVRGDGGFVVAPGSLHKTGARYETVDDRDPAPCPEWLAEWLRARPTNERAAGDNAPVPCSGDELARRIPMAKKFLAVAPAPPERAEGVPIWHAALYLVRKLELPLDLAQEMLNEYNASFAAPWVQRTADEIRHKLEDARDRSDMATGVPPENFLATPEAKKILDGPHVHTFDPNNAIRLTRDKMANVEVLQLLWELNHGEWQNVFRYNEFDERIYAFRPPLKMTCEKGAARLSDEDATAVRGWLEYAREGKTSKDEIVSAVALSARGRPYHPIRDWLSALPAPTTHHLDNLAETLFGDARPIAQSYVRKHLIGSVARVVRPGCQMDTTLVLVGPAGGELKSSVIERLYRVPNCETFRTDIPGIDDLQKIGQALDGTWVVELAELASLKKSSVEAMKSFLTRRVERFSPKYVAGEIARPRQCVCMGTTNVSEFLPPGDSAFRRRFWPVSVIGRVDLRRLDDIRDEIWSEAFAAYSANEPWWYDDEREADAGRVGFITHDSFGEAVEAALAGPLALRNDSFTPNSAIYEALGYGKVPDASISTRVGVTMRALGYKAAKKNHVRGWTK